MHIITIDVSMFERFGMVILTNKDPFSPTLSKKMMSVTLLAAGLFLPFVLNGDHVCDDKLNTKESSNSFLPLYPNATAIDDNDGTAHSAGPPRTTTMHAKRNSSSNDTHIWHEYVGI
jgi:hypothetical protein